jgi:hypothetical protein
MECKLPDKSELSVRSRHDITFLLLPNKPFSSLKYLKIEFSKEGLKPKSEKDKENGKSSKSKSTKDSNQSQIQKSFLTTYSLWTPIYNL